MTTTFKIGNHTVHRVIEQEPFTGFDVHNFFPKLTPQILAANPDWKPKYVTPDNKLVLCIQSYLVRTGKQNILIDTCVGNHKDRPARAF